MSRPANNAHLLNQTSFAQQASTNVNLPKAGGQMPAVPLAAPSPSTKPKPAVPPAGQKMVIPASTQPTMTTFTR